MEASWLAMGKKHNSSKGILKGPRFSPDDRLGRRFYEPLVLLNLLDRNGEQRILNCPSEDDITPLSQTRELRRDFLRQLAYVCDYVKGGDTVTAIALQKEPSNVTFWVASNKNISKNTISFLRGILTTLQCILSSEKDCSVIENEISQRCIAFNLKRLKEYQILMRKYLIKCLVELKSAEEIEGGLVCYFIKYKLISLRR